MALRMGIFVGTSPKVTCVSGHYYEEPQGCDLCQAVHAQEALVIKNRAGKKMRVAASCLREMVRFKVTDVEDLPQWLAKMGDLEKEVARRKTEQEKLRQEERQRLEKKVIVRRRPTEQSAR